MAEASNVHASGVVVGDRCVLRGEPGSGKTGLALALVIHARGSGLFARLVADDQLFVSARNGRLLACAPPAIAGLAEVRGLGPRAVPFERRAVVDLLVRLVDPAVAPRYPDRAGETLLGVPVACLTLTAGDRQAAVFAVASHLDLPPFALF